MIFKKTTYLFLICVFFFLFYQNCSNGYVNSSAFDREDSESSRFCFVGECFDETLWIKIREVDPYTVNQNSQDGGFFNIHGVCGSGLSSDSHEIVYQVEDSYGSGLDVLSKGSFSNFCRFGEFQIPISLDFLFEEDQIYTLSVAIIRPDQNFRERVFTSNTSNVSQIQIIFE